MNMADVLFEEFKLYEPNLWKLAGNWYMFDHFELMVVLNDGRKILYDGLEKTTRMIDASYSDEDLSEVQFRFEFSRRLRKKMQQSGFDQRMLSEKSGVSVVTLSAYMNGRSTPSLFITRKIAQALNCSVEELLRFPK